MGLNRVCISGNLTRASELRATSSGTAVLNMRMAVNDRRKNPQTGEWEEAPNYVTCTMFGNRAEKLAPYLSKGNKVAIEGRLRWREWEKDGQRREALEVIVDELEFLSPRDSGQTNQTGGYGGIYEGAKGGEYRQQDVYDEDIPF